VKEEHEPRFWIKKSFYHLILLESFVFNTCLILPDLVDNNRFLALGNELRADWIIRQEDADDACPYNSHRTCDPKHGSPLVFAGKKANPVSNRTRKTDTRT
jgi:hypothetical protein